MKSTDCGQWLDDVRVLDASRVLAGPLCGQILGDLGADVLKIERPGSGDESRGWGPPFVSFQGNERFSAYFLSCNRNKRGLALDLASTEGVALFQRLVEKSDVVLENFLPRSAAKLGLDPARLHAINPRLVICSISGFGRTGPLADAPGYDLAIQALSGLMSITGPVEGPPSKVGVAIVDVLTGMNAAIAVLACLHARKRSGHGYHIDLALLDSALASQVNLAQAYLASGKEPPRQGNAHLQIVPYELFATQDGHLVLAVGNDAQWQRFCQVAGCPDLGTDPRYATNPLRVQGRAELIPHVATRLREHPTAWWVEQLTQSDVPHAPVWGYADLFAHPQVAARNLRVTVTDPDGRPIDLLGSPFHIDGESLPLPCPPPDLGQHTNEVLHEMLGLSHEEIDRLRKQGVVG
jgi:crotonobetainyl-CoA:carnitine CoA-transferase CaiB-like acyl-CoA transferase